MRENNSLKDDRSRYVHGGVTEATDTNIEYWNRKKLSFDASDRTLVLERVYEGRPELLSSVLYDDSRLWWVICQMNSILDINEEFVEGKVLVIPTKQRIEREFFNGNKNGIPSKREVKPVLKKVIV